MEGQRPRKRRKFSEEFKADTVRLVQTGGKSLVQIARDLDLTPSAVTRWVQQAAIEAGRGHGRSGKSTPGAFAMRARGHSSNVRSNHTPL